MSLLVQAGTRKTFGSPNQRVYAYILFVINQILVIRKITNNCRRQNSMTFNRSLFVILFYLHFVVRDLILFSISSLVLHAQIIQIANIR